MDFSTVIMGLVGSVTARVMTTLGLGFLSYTALKVIATQLQTKIFLYYSLMNSDMIKIFDLAGIGEFIHIICAAFITKAGLMAIKRIGVMPT